jgi:hypothetical protein
MSRANLLFLGIFGKPHYFRSFPRQNLQTTCPKLQVSLSSLINTVEKALEDPPGAGA